MKTYTHVYVVRVEVTDNPKAETREELLQEIRTALVLYGIVAEIE